MLHELADGGAALELAIGTGRIALPLQRRGTPVAGIELSAAMVRQMRAKPGAADIPVTIGDMATATVEGTFSLAYLVFNTIGNLTTQQAQVDCFANAAKAPATRRPVRDRDRPAAAAAAPAGRDREAVPPQRGAPRLRRVRHRQPGPDLAPLRARDGHYEKSSVPFRYTGPPSWT